MLRCKLHIQVFFRYFEKERSHVLYKGSLLVLGIIPFEWDEQQRQKSRLLFLFHMTMILKMIVNDIQTQNMFMRDA